MYGIAADPHRSADGHVRAGETLAERLEERRDRLLLLLCRQFGLPMDEGNAAATLLMSELKEESLLLLEKGTGQ